MPTAEQLANAHHNLYAEIENLESKFIWFEKNNYHIRDLFIDGNLKGELTEKIAIPDYLKKEIAKIREWHEQVLKSIP